MVQKRKHRKVRRTPLPPNKSQSKFETSKQQQHINAINSIFARIQQAQHVIEYRIRNYTQEDLERYTADIIRYQSQLIDINNYAYMVLGLFRDLIDFYVKPVLYRWTLNTQVKLGFNQQSQDPIAFQQDYTSYAAKINQLDLGREIHRILLKMFLEDAVFGYWIEEAESSTIFYLPSAWCILRHTVNGNWTYLLNTPRISDRDIEQLPAELAGIVRRYKPRGGEDALAPVPFEKVVCFKYNDHTNTIFPPFTHVLLLIIDLMKAKQLALTQIEQDVVNLIQMLIPIDDKNDDHLRFTDPIIEKYAIGLQELLAENNAVLPTPMELSVLNTNKNNNVDMNIVTDAMDAYHNETGLPRFGGSNTAAEMKRALEFAASKVYVILDQISSAINLKMKHDGFIHDHYEFVFQILHMTRFNEIEVLENMLKHTQAGAVNKIALEAARGNNPSMLLGQHYTENVVYRSMFEHLLVPPSSHTQSSGGRPASEEGQLTESGEQSRADNTNDPANRDVYERREDLNKMVCVVNKNTADKLAGMGYRYLKQTQNGAEVYMFMKSEDLLAILNNNKQFNKKHWYLDSHLKF